MWSFIQGGSRDLFARSGRNFSISRQTIRYVPSVRGVTRQMRFSARHPAVGGGPGLCNPQTRKLMYRVMQGLTGTCQLSGRETGYPVGAVAWRIEARRAFAQKVWVRQRRNDGFRQQV